MVRMGLLFGGHLTVFLVCCFIPKEVTPINCENFPMKVSTKAAIRGFEDNVYVFIETSSLLEVRSFKYNGRRKRLEIMDKQPQPPTALWKDWPRDSALKSGLSMNYFHGFVTQSIGNQEQQLTIFDDRRNKYSGNDANVTLLKAIYAKHEKRIKVITSSQSSYRSDYIWILEHVSNVQDEVTVYLSSEGLDPLFAKKIETSDYMSFLFTDYRSSMDTKDFDGFVIKSKYIEVVTVSVNISQAMDSMPFQSTLVMDILSQTLIGCPNVFCYSSDIDSMYKHPSEKVIILNSGRHEWRLEEKPLPLVVPMVADGHLLDHKVAFADMAFAFSDNLVIVMKENNVYVNGGRSLAVKKVFPGLEGRRVDTGWVIEKEKRVYILSRGQYWAYTRKDTGFGFDLVNGFPQSILDFKGIPIHLDAAFPYKGFVYLLKQNFYYKLPEEGWAAKEPFEPQLIYGSNGIFDSSSCDYENKFGFTFDELVAKMMRNKPTAHRPSKRLKNSSNNSLDFVVFGVILMVIFALMVIYMGLMAFADSSSEPAKKEDSDSVTFETIDEKGKQTPEPNDSPSVSRSKARVKERVL